VDVFAGPAMHASVAIARAVDVVDLLHITGEHLPGVRIVGARGDHAVQNEGMGAGELAFAVRVGELHTRHFPLQSLKKGGGHHCLPSSRRHATLA
jgi:hypothetical protein